MSELDTLFGFRTKKTSSKQDLVSLGWPYTTPTIKVRLQKNPVFSSGKRMVLSKKQRKQVVRKQRDWEREKAEYWQAGKQLAGAGSDAVVAGFEAGEKGLHKLSAASRRAGSWVGEKIVEYREKKAAEKVKQGEIEYVEPRVKETVGERVLVSSNPEAMEKAKQQIKEGKFKGYI